MVDGAEHTRHRALLSRAFTRRALERWERERPILWEHEGNCAVRDGRFKLVKKHPGDWELYDMVEDRTELNDLAEVNRPQVKKMVAAWEEWADRCGILPWAEVLEHRKQMHG